MPRKVHDGIIYNGEIDVLAMRLFELADLAASVVVVEAESTFSGQPKKLSFNRDHPRIAPFSDRLHHVIVRDMPNVSDPWIRERWQRDAIMRGFQNVPAEDLILICDADEIPRRAVVNDILHDVRTPAFGFYLPLSYFYVNYRRVGDPEITAVAATKAVLTHIPPTTLRAALRAGAIPGARLIAEAGWHLSFLGDNEAVRRKIRAYSHQEFNTEEFLRQIDVGAIVKQGADLFGRGAKWAIQDGELPALLTQDDSMRRRLSWQAAR